MEVRRGKGKEGMKRGKEIGGDEYKRRLPGKRRTGKIEKLWRNKETQKKQ